MNREIKDTLIHIAIWPFIFWWITEFPISSSFILTFFITDF